MTDNELFGNSEQLEKDHFADPGKMVGDLVSRQAVVDLIEEVENKRLRGEIDLTYAPMIKGIKAMPSAQPEPLTDKEQRIFLAAMEREEKVCKEVDRNYVREPYEDSLMRVCKEIRRKVKGALWT